MNGTAVASSRQDEGQQRTINNNNDIIDYNGHNNNDSNNDSLLGNISEQEQVLDTVTEIAPVMSSSSSSALFSSRNNDYYDTVIIKKNRQQQRNNKRRRRRWLLSVFGSFVVTACIMSIIQAVYFHSDLPFAITIPNNLLESHPEWKVDTSTSNNSNTTITTTTTTDQTTVRKEEVVSSKEETDNNNNKDHNILYNVLEHADVLKDLTLEERGQIPAVYESIVSMYGSEPIIWGLETCKEYRDNVKQRDRIVAVAGMFNTGTNNMEYHLRKNIVGINKKWQVPWGKHRVPKLRLNHTAPNMENVIQENVLPVIMIRDPYHWMQSMCKNAYAAKWKHTKIHCPNLVPNDKDKERFGAELKQTNNNFEVTVYFDKNQVISWDSLIHLYIDWYKQYYIDANYPRLIVRFEDMLLHAPIVMKQIAQCVGGKVKINKEFTYQINSAKSHGSHTNFFHAITKTADQINRLKLMSIDDLQYAAKYLNQLDLFHNIMKYQIPTEKINKGWMNLSTPQ